MRLVTYLSFRIIQSLRAEYFMRGPAFEKICFNKYTLTFSLFQIYLLACIQYYISAMQLSCTPIIFFLSLHIGNTKPSIWLQTGMHLSGMKFSTDASKNSPKTTPRVNYGSSAVMPLQKRTLNTNPPPSASGLSVQTSLI